MLLLLFAGPPRPVGAPDAILAATNLTGTVQELWDDPTAPDADFLDPVDPSAATDLRVSFPTPATAPGSGGPVLFQVWVYRTGHADWPTVWPTVWPDSPVADPTVIVDLWESGAFVAQLASVTVTSTSGQLITGTMNPALLADPFGAGVELRVRGVPV